MDLPHPHVTIASHPIEDPAFAMILMSTLDPDSTEESGVMSKPNEKLSPLFQAQREVCWWGCRMTPILLCPGLPSSGPAPLLSKPYSLCLTTSCSACWSALVAS